MAATARPNSITLFNRLNLAATSVGIANIFAHYGVLRNLAISNGASPAGPFLGIILLVLSYLIFWFFIYRRGSKIAKWVFVVVTASAVLMVPLHLPEIIGVGTAYAIADCIAFLLQLGAASMLFRGDAILWLSRKNGKPAEM